ncbi:MAG TPA: hypothetical protein PLZ55_01385 [bacterium]|nr:hypothetical protein [bacterium]HQQ00512.1 hypothetical protein [bacterium]
MSIEFATVVPSEGIGVSRDLPGILVGRTGDGLPSASMRDALRKEVLSGHLHIPMLPDMATCGCFCRSCA